MLKRLTDKDVLLFGEYHNNAIAHWLQLEVTKDLKEKRELVLGAEMFERDNQEALDLYLAGTIKQKQLDSMARLWKNYPTDYAPLVNFAKEHKIAFAATNVPRRYAAMCREEDLRYWTLYLAKKKHGWPRFPLHTTQNYPVTKK